MNQPRVSIIILNWKGAEDTIECLESIFQCKYSNYDIVIVDNASNDGSIDRIKSYADGKAKIKSKFFSWNQKNKPIGIFYINKAMGSYTANTELKQDKKLIILENDANYGFAQGNNEGINYAMNVLNPDYIMLLNNDTVVDKYFLECMVSFGERDPKIGLIGPKIYFYNHPDIIQSIGVKIHWHIGECRPIGGSMREKYQYVDNMEVDSISGCAMLVKNEIFKNKIFLDNKYFLYYEDTDFCMRVKNAGYGILSVPTSKIWHKTSMSSRRNGIREYYSARNLFLFMRRYSRKTDFYLFCIYFLFFKFWFNLAVIILYHKDFEAIVPFMRGSFHGLIKRY